MGTPNNQTDTRTTEDILREVICTPAHLINQRDLRATGIDVGLLAKTEEMIHPYLDYLHGYQPLEKCDPLEKTRWAHVDHRVDASAEIQWLRFLRKAGHADRHAKVLQVARQSMRCSDKGHMGPSHIMLAAYLTRAGKWLLWYGIGNEAIQGRFSYEKLSFHESVQDMWAEAETLCPDDYQPYGIYTGGQTLPIIFAQGLERLLAATIEERSERLRSMERAQDAIKRMSSVIRL